jgi:hypothetical protein
MMSEAKDDFGPLKFASKSIIVKPAKDPLARARNKFATGLQEQSKIAAELRIKQSDDMPLDEQRRKRMFFRNGDGKSYIISPKYGKREVVIKDGNTLYADDLTEVGVMLDFLAAATIRKETWIDQALSAVASRSKVTVSKINKSTDESTVDEDTDADKAINEIEEKLTPESDKKQPKHLLNHQRNRN